MTTETQATDQATDQKPETGAPERAPRQEGQPTGPAARMAARLIEAEGPDMRGLRRMGQHLPESQAAWRLMAENGLTGDSGTERTWGFIIHCIALMTPAVYGRSAHSARIPVGRALFLGGESRREKPFYGENRLGQLVQARGRNLEEKLVQLVRMLGRNGARLDWDELAQLVIDERTDPRAAEAGFAKILRDYYRAAPRGRTSSR